MKSTIDQYGYPCEPRTIDDRCWFYEQRSGIQILIDGNESTIPWRKIEAAVDRHRKIKSAKKQRASAKKRNNK